MATTSSTSSVRTLESIQSIQFIRANTVVVDVAGARPNTRLHIFFDGILVNQYCAPKVGGNSADVGQTIPTTVNVNLPIVSDSSGAAVFTFKIPPLTFTTGEKTILVSEVDDLDLLSLPGTPYGSARSVYSTRGTLETYQRITTTTNVTENVVHVQSPPQRSDPLAQSFFTHGVTGGMFLTAIELFFQSKDSSIPIQVELREMSMGFPKELDRSNPDLVSVVPASKVFTNTTAQMAAGTATGTKFHFNPPVYLKEDGDFCFVVFTNSNKYNIYTSKMGEVSLENKKTILSQPYVGSLFKSENNYTWTAEQTEDIKFKIYKAKFGLTQGVATFQANQLNLNVPGTKIYTVAKTTPTSTTATIIYYGDTRHGLGVGDKIAVGADSNAKYNNIPGNKMIGEFPVTTVIDDFTVEYAITVDSSTIVTEGYVENSGIIRAIHVLDGGSGYNTAPTLTIEPAPLTGTNSTAVANISNGKIVSVTVTQGTGLYTETPIVVVNNTGTGGSGVTLQVSTAATFTISPNLVYSLVSPQINARMFGSSTITGEMKNMYSTSYTFDANNKPFDPLKISDLENMYRLANRFNENLRISNNSSLEVTMNLATDNPNVSPVIDLRTTPKLVLGSYKLNDQHNTNFVKTTGGISRITSLVGGTSYSGTPTVTIVPAANDVTGSGAELTPTVDGGVITELVITEPGSGYTSNPTIIITDGTGSGATATCELDQTAQNGSIRTVDVLVGGSGYLVAPTVTVTPAKNDKTGTGAVLQASIDGGGVVTGINIVNRGNGYTQVPTITLSAAPVGGTTATAAVTLTNYNSEAGGIGDPRGGAYTRYLTKKIALTTISTGIRLISHIDSSPETSVDVYIRTSLSGANVNHVDQPWTLLTCDVERNKSTYRGNFFEYTFYNNNLIPFDVYDLKFVLSSTNPARTPAVNNYRVIISV